MTIFERGLAAGRKVLGLPKSLEEQIYAGVVRRGDVAFDIGANAGDVTTFLARLIGADGKVVAFEPVWPVYEQLCRRIRNLTRFNAPVVPVPMGLADFDGSGHIQVPNSAFGLGSLASSESWRAAQCNAKVLSYRCTFTKLDTFISSPEIGTPTFIKVDVEGAELLVLRGATRYFEEGNRPMMLMEIFAPWERAMRYEPWKVLSVLISYGYNFMFACPEGLVPYQPTRAQPFPPPYVNGYNVLIYEPDRHLERIKSLESLRMGGRGKVLPVPPPPQLNEISSGFSDSAN